MEVQSPRTLLQDRDPHRAVEPVQNVLSLRLEILRQRSYILAAIGEEGDLLIGLHALQTQQLEEPALGLLVDTSHQRKAFT